METSEFVITENNLLNYIFIQDDVIMSFSFPKYFFNEI